MKKKKTSALCVPLREAESVRRDLKENNFLLDDVEIFKNEKCIYFPVKDIPAKLYPYMIVKKIFKKIVVKPRSYKDLLTLPKKTINRLPTSYDVVGSIILIKLPKTLFRHYKKIGKALLEVHKNIRTVCIINPVSGEFRTRNVQIIAGENNTITTHTEYGLKFDINVSTTYFSPRLASERKRVASLVKQDEIIVDLFAGVAPFSIMIARYAKPKIVYAIDKSVDATKFAQQNVKQNNVLDFVEVIHADANDVTKIISKKADRIIMNLPFSAYKFFPLALSIAEKNCIIHYYDIIKDKDIESRINELKKIAVENRYSISKFSIRKIKTYAPREFYIGIDITATKHADVA